MMGGACVLLKFIEFEVDGLLRFSLPGGAAGKRADKEKGRGRGYLPRPG